MSHAKILFEETEAFLLDLLHTVRCSDAQIKHVRGVHRDIFVSLDTISSKIRMKHGDPTTDDFATLERSL
jgi:hypothetical protein